MDNRERETTNITKTPTPHHIIPHPPTPHHIIGIPLGTRVHRIDRLGDVWRVWIATKDYMHGTFIDLHMDGHATHTCVRVDEGDDTILIRPPDGEAVDKAPTVSTNSEHQQDQGVNQHERK